jgi:Tfp pilus assembly protein PilF
MNAEAFITEFAEHTQKMENKRFCFLLGAGASKPSGISLGSELALDWLKEIHVQEAPPGELFETWATEENLGIEGFDLKHAASFYTRIFERRFDGQMDTGQFWLEQKFGKAIPSPGYYFLAQILHQSPHKVVVTTNFDNLAADTVLQLAGNLPRIISDARIARYLSPQPRLPIIAKVHGDIGFATTKNTTDGVAKLDEEWKDPLRRILSLYTPIIIGWEGNDGSLMDFLTSEMVDKDGLSLLPAGIYWCYRPDKTWQDRIASNTKLQALTRVHAVRFISIDGFDEFLLKLAQSLKLPNPLEKLRDQQEQRLKVFGANLREEAKRIKKIQTTGGSGAESMKEGSAELLAMIEVFEAAQEKNDDKRLTKLQAVAEKFPTNPEAQAAVAVELHLKKKNNDMADKYYLRSLQLNSSNANTLGNYAAFLQIQRKDDGRAEEYYQKALTADPNNATNLGNYASFLKDQRKDADRAEEYYQKALIADPNNAANLGNYANFLVDQRKDADRAEEYYQKALAADPNNAAILGSYANFLVYQRKADDRAEEYYQKALAADPNNAAILGSYANFLVYQRKADDRAEEYYQKALAADPNNAAILGNYAIFFKDQRKDDDRAEEYYQKALTADPNHAINLGNYASFLKDQRKDDDRAEEHYQKALTADPNHAINLGNYAAFLQIQRKDADRAEEYYQKALAADPNNAAILGSYANFLHTQRKDDDRAEEYYQKAVSADPNHAHNLGNYAQFLTGRGKFVDASTQAQQAWAALKDRYDTNAAEVVFTRWLLTSVAGKDGQLALGRLKTILRTGFERFPWSFDAMLAACAPRLKAKEKKLAQKLASAILDESKIEELEADAVWKTVKAIPLDEPWPEDNA